MIDEEKVEEYVNEIEYCDIVHNDISDSDTIVYDKDQLIQAVMYGLAEGRKEKWHDLRKNPDDLPKESGHYLTDDGDTYVYDTDCRKWRTPACMNCWDFDWLDDGDIIAWCELPKFESRK